MVEQITASKNIFSKKYPDSNLFLLLKSLNYFTDAEEDEALTLLQEADWAIVKKTIEEEVKNIYR